MSDDYTPGTSRSAYFPAGSNAVARLWSKEKLAHDLGDLGAIEFFEGVGNDPTGLSGYSITKLWLRPAAAGITTAAGTVRYYAGGDDSLLASWPELTKEGFLTHLGGSGYTGYGPRMSSAPLVSAPETWWIEFEAFLPGIATRETAGGQASFTREYMREKIRALYRLGARRFIIVAVCVNGRTYTDWGITTPVDPSGATFDHWWNDVSGAIQPYTDDFDVLAEMFSICDGLDGATVVVGLGRHDDTQLANDLYTVDFLSGVDPLRFSKTLATRLSEEITRHEDEAADVFERFGSRRSFGGFYVAHESDHLQSSADLYTPICDALRVYGEVHVAVATPLDFADSNTIADAINSYHADWLWVQTSAGYGYNWSTGYNAYVSGISIVSSAAHMASWKALAERARGRTGGGYTPKIGVDIENWRVGVQGSGTLTFGALTGTGISVTLGTPDAITSASIGKDIYVRADQLTGIARITAVTGNPVTSVTVTITENLADVNIASGFWAIVPDLTDATVDTYPALASEVIYEIAACAPYADGVSIYGEVYWDPGTLSLVLRQAQGGSGASDYRTRALAGWSAFETAVVDASAATRWLAWNARSLVEPGADRIFFWDYDSASGAGSFKFLTLTSNFSLSGTTLDINPAQTGAVSINTGPLAGLRNRLLNGGMRVNQRASATNADDTYSFDRWNILTQTGTVAISSIADIENTWTHALRITQSQASAQRFGLSQIIEGVNCRDLRGQAVTLSARVRSSASTTLRYAVLEWTGTVDSVTSDVVNDWTSATLTAGNFFLGASLTVTATGSTALTAATAATVSLSTTLGSSVNNVIVLFWTDSTQAQNVTIDFGKVMLEVGASASVFEYIPHVLDVEMCRRYYQKVASGSHGDAEDTSIILMGTQFVPPMRAAPTLTLDDSTPTFTAGGGGSVSGTASTIAGSSVTARGGYLRIDGFAGALTAGRAYVLAQDDAVSAAAEL